MKIFQLTAAMFAFIAFAAGANAAEWPIQFKEVRGPMPEIGHITSEEFDEARDAFEAEYAIEEGFRTVLPGENEELVVIVSNWRYAKRIFSKMQRNGDVVQSRGQWMFKYISEYDPELPNVRYYHFGRAFMDQGASVSFGVQGRPQYVTQFYVRMHKDCSAASAGVHAADARVRIRPTKLLEAKRAGNYVEYFYSVNGGEGVDITGISVTLAPPRSWILVTNCQVDVFAAYDE